MKYKLEDEVETGFMLACNRDHQVFRPQTNTQAEISPTQTTRLFEATRLVEGSYLRTSVLLWRMVRVTTPNPKP